MSTSYEYEGAVFLEVALGVVTQRQTPCVTNSRTTAKKTTFIRFCSTLEIKRIHNALICGAFCDINKSLIKSVWKNYTKSYPRPFSLILWTSFIPQEMKMLILLANSQSSFITVKWFLACQTNTPNCCFLILTTLPASKFIVCDSNDPIDHGAER